MKKQLKLFVAFCFIKCVAAFSQSCPTYTSFSAVLQGTNQVTYGNTINFPVTSKAGTTVLREKNKSAKIYFKLDLGNDYVKQNTSTWKFKVTVDITYKFALPGSVATVKTLTITDKAPEMLKIEDALGAFATTSPAFGSTVNIVAITDGTNTLTGTGLLQDFIFKNLRLKIELAREFDVDVRFASTAKMSNAPVIFPSSISNRLVTFSWQPNASNPYPNYELQVLKLFNTDPSLQNDLNQITSNIDWSKALNIETQSCKTSIQLTMGEGTGYYIWRVRPIGTYFAGGISNSENYGEWSATVSPTVNTVSLNKVTLNPTSVSTPYAFYFKDPDEDINWIYSRVFTEGDTYDKNNPTGVKSSEGMSYADGLLRVRQNQKFNSSENTNIVSQTVNDYSGRPALSTIPVPTVGGLTGYKKALVKDPSGNLYTAENFDKDTKIANPDQVKDVGTAYSYYSANSSLSNNGIDNPNVPSAEGYPFKRTIFKTDGTNRVEEESGVGKMHSIGSQTLGQGRTTRISYSTPSEDELIRIFGDEAPLSQSVIKTTTIDQNNVTSISYTSKEGKTIATALSSSSVSNLTTLGGAITTFTVNNAINQNVYSPGKIVASKRISVSSNATVLNLSHTTDKLIDDNAGCIQASCNYQLRIYLKDIKNNITYVSDANTGVSGIDNFSTSAPSSLTFPSTWAFVDVNTTSTNTPIYPGGTYFDQITLNEGEYVFIKELYSANGPGYGENLANDDNEKTRPIFDAIANRMKNVSGPVEKAAFDAWMAQLRVLVTAYNAAPVQSHSALTTGLLSHLSIDPALLKPGFLFPDATLFNLSASTTSTNDPTMDNLEITTSCCGSISAQVPKTTICIACEGSPEAAYQTTTTITNMVSANATAAASVITPYGFNDFKDNTGWSSMTDLAKRTAINTLVEREFINVLKDKMDEELISHNDLWKIAPGFSFESLNFMISNMLISQYYTGSAIKSGSNWFEATKNSQGTYNLGSMVSASNPTYTYNYDCKKLIDAWQLAMAPLNGYEMETGSGNVLKGFDKSEGPGAALLEALNTDNWSPPLRAGLDLLKGAIGKVMNKFSNSKNGSVSKEKVESLSCITSMFMQISGQQYAAIIDGSPLPNYINSTGGRYPDEYYDFTPSTTPTPSTIYTTVVTGNASTGTVSNTYVPLLFTMNANAVEISTTTCNSVVVDELYYPYILKPEWMFKYFVYNVFENQGNSTGALNFIDDNDHLLPNQVSIDLSRSYNPPFSYLTAAAASGLSSTDLCYQPVTSSFTVSSVSNNFTYTHENWSAKERGEFYDLAKGGGNCSEFKGISTTDNFYDGNVLPVCPTKTELFALANDILTQRIAGATGMALDIKTALIGELEASCYTLVPCKSAPALPGEVTLKEIDLMVAAVISKVVSEIQSIKDNFTVTPITNVSACTSVASLTQTYSPIASCNLPACVQTDCKEIVLYENNTIGLTNSRKMAIKLFMDCDQKLLDMLELGDFLPHVPPINGCTNTKVWKSCIPVNSCGNYGEKDACSSPQYEKFSKEYTITATGSGN